MNRPQTREGRQVWDLASRLEGQVRIAPGGVVMGWDMAAALALGAALGIEAAATAELLPVIETEMARAINQRNEGGGDG